MSYHGVVLAGFELVEENPHFRFGLRPEQAVMLMTRRGNEPVTAVQVRSMMRSPMFLIGDTHRWGILLDTREAVGRNDPAFEQEALAVREFMLEHFARVAVLVRSAAGEMQVSRLQDRKQRMSVFREPSEALAFAAGEL